MIYTFETISPRELLINKNNGNEPTRRDLKLIEDLLVDYKLKPGVVNVLLDYAINVNNKKLTRGFVETIAGEWQRKGPWLFWFQYLYYLAEVGLVFLIVAFGQG